MKKVISFVLIVFMLASSCVTVFAEDTASAPEVLVDKEVSEETISWLETLGVMLPDSDGFITRGEFILAVTDMLGISMDSASEAVFTDVDAATKLGAAVYNAVNAGLVSKGTEFYPDNEISYAEGCKILTHLLGYVPDAQIHGGWPAGYLYVADKLDLKLSMSADRFTFYDFCEILKKASMTEIRDVVGVSVTKGGTNLDYAIGDTFAEVYHDMSYIDGIIEANPISHIYNPNAPSDDDSLMINGQTYYCTDWADYQLGMYVYGYVKEIGNRKTIRGLWTDENNITEILSVDAPAYSSGKLTWYDNDKEKRAVISPETALIYNGKAATAYGNDIYAISDGKIVLVSNDGDNNPDIVHIYKYDYMVVSNAESKQEIIRDANSGMKLELSDSICIFENFAYADLKSGSVLEYVKSVDGKYYSFNLIKETVSGDIDSIGEDEGFIFLNSVPYEYTSYFDDYYKAVAVLGSSAKMTLSSEGKLVKMELTAGNALSFAYAYDYAYNTESLDQYYCMKCFDQNGDIVILRLDSRVDYNGSSITDKTAYDNLKAVGETLIRFKESGGKVRKIVTDDGLGGVYSPGTDGSDALRRYHYSGYDSATDKIPYRYQSGYFVPYFFVTSDTIVFSVTPAETESDETKRFSVGYGTGVLGRIQDPYRSQIIPYNVTDDGKAGALVYRNDGSSDQYIGTLSAPHAIVSRVAMTADEDGNPLYALTLYWGDSYFDITVEPDVWFIDDYFREGYTATEPPFSVGDYLMYNERDSKMVGCRRQYNAKLHRLEAEQKYHNSEVNNYVGTLIGLSDSTCKLLITQDVNHIGSELYFPLLSTIVVVKKDKSVLLRPSSELVNYLDNPQSETEILINCRTSDPLAIVVYEK